MHSSRIKPFNTREHYHCWGSEDYWTSLSGLTSLYRGTPLSWFIDTAQSASVIAPQRAIADLIIPQSFYLLSFSGQLLLAFYTWAESIQSKMAVHSKLFLISDKDSLTGTAMPGQNGQSFSRRTDLKLEMYQVIWVKRLQQQISYRKNNGYTP